ncbi:hypothetical protein AVEN_11205-1 [Araneus ventricosus]|uniref:Uncharacterized protein n=1 Tax=Araneus ventricosus TaxID=182803 RepID=A0A4Y2IWI3_ARAVE|nr:hypothetical protein AVEN_11205-1 [Araneus ventricosus]
MISDMWSCNRTSRSVPNFGSNRKKENAQNVYSVSFTILHKRKTHYTVLLYFIFVTTVYPELGARAAPCPVLVYFITTVYPELGARTATCPVLVYFITTVYPELGARTVLVY